MHSSAIIVLAFASMTAALEFSDRVVERSPSHETVALAPVDLASLPAWDQAAFEKSHPDLVRSTNAPRAAGEDTFVPGQVLFGNGGFFNSFGQNPMMMGAPLFMVQQPLHFPSAIVSSDDGNNFKWSSINAEGDREISVIQ